MTWYLLFGGCSEDGRGPGVYVGRTMDKYVAEHHHKKCLDNPYSTGYVMIATNTTYTRMV